MWSVRWRHGGAFVEHEHALVVHAVGLTTFLLVYVAASVCHSIAQSPTTVMSSDLVTRFERAGPPKKSGK